MIILKKFKINKWYWDFSLILAKAEFKLRNEGSYLGLLYYFLNPLFTFILLNFIFSAKFGQGIASYSLYLLLGIIMFNFFQSTTNESTKIIMHNRNIIKSVSFPKWTLNLSIVIKYLFSHIFEMLIFVILMFFSGAPFLGILFYPLILFLFLVFIFGVCLSFSSISVYFVDLENIWIFASRLLWLATPIFYTTEKGTNLFLLNLFNPLYYFLTVSRDIVIYTKTPDLWLITGVINWTLLSCTIGVLLYKKLNKRFPEMV